MKPIICLLRLHKVLFLKCKNISGKRCVFLTINFLSQADIDEYTLGKTAPLFTSVSLILRNILFKSIFVLPIKILKEVKVVVLM